VSWRAWRTNMTPIFTSLSRSVVMDHRATSTLGELERLVHDLEQGRQDHSAILWLVLVFETFLNARETT
jgi:hypothetical protein